MWHYSELGILRLLRNRISGIRNNESTRTTKLRLCITDEALIGIVPRPVAIGIGADLRKQRIQLSRKGRTIRDVITAVAGGLQLSGARNAFLKRLALTLVDGCACGRVRTDQRRMRDWNPLLL